ncbi:MAG: response regulator [Geobacter sp.]|nr:response regulator [Geobacter sp.]
MANILIIDDNEQVRKVMATYLEHDNHQITVAADGKQGIAQLQSQAFDLVITDIIMPEQDGLEVLMWLRTQAHRPKVIAVSGGCPSLDLNYLITMAQRLSADKVLQKPIDFATLTTAVRELLA